MEYECVDCGWHGHWDELILETICPVCRGRTVPRKDHREHDHAAAPGTVAASAAGAVPY